MAVRLKVSDLTTQELVKIQSDLTFIPKTYNFYKGRRNYASSTSKTPLIVFHTDGDLIRLPKAYANKNFPDKIIPNTGIVPTSFKFIRTLYEIQGQVVRDAWNILSQTKTVILGLYTGFGKTITAVYLASLLKGLVLIFVDGVTIVDQWRKVFEKFTDAKVWVVGEEIPPEANVVICMITRVDKLTYEYKMAVRIIIVDEAHCFATPKRIPGLLAFEPEYVIIATATPNRTDKMFPAIEAFGGWDMIYLKSTKPFDVIKYNTGIAVPIELNKQGTPDWAALTRNLCQSEERNNLILEIIKMNNPVDFKILILSWRSDHVDNLFELIQKTGRSVDKMSKSKRSYKDSSVLIGTISKIGKAFDEENLCEDFNGMRLNLLIMVGSMNSEVLLEQVAGRVFRAEFPNIIYFCDDNPISQKHWRVAQGWFSSRNGVISSMDSPLVNKIENNDALDNSGDIARRQLENYRRRFL